MMNKNRPHRARVQAAWLAFLTGILVGSSSLADETFTMDVTGRLLQADFGTAGSIHYEYDVLGHLTNLTITATSQEADTDGDQLPDAWEWVYFNGLSEVADIDLNQNGLSNLEDFQQGSDPATNDNDQDGFLNADELIAGTDPFSATSYPRLSPVSAQPHTLAWEGVSGRLYQVQRAMDLTAEFEPMTGFQPNAAPGNQWTDPNPPVAGAFYRLEVKLE